MDNYKVVNVLKWAVKEMEDRYKLFEKVGARDIGSYLEKVAAGEMKKEIDPDTGTVEHEPIEKIPYIVIIIDELSDLMSSHKKEVEGAIVRIAQMARAVGIHLIVSTQRPSVQVLTGLIKANISTRIAFKVTSQIDSRTILDRSGAEKLLGRGDMLYACDASKPQRIQGVFVSENEVKELVSFIINNNDRRRKDDIDLPDMTKATVDITKDPGELDFSLDEQNDDLYNEVKKEILLSKRASASFIQRRFRVGYTRAARLLDLLESNGVIGPVNGAKPREIYGSAYESDANHTDSSGQSGEAETYSEE